MYVWIVTCCLLVDFVCSQEDKKKFDEASRKYYSFLSGHLATKVKKRDAASLAGVPEVHICCLCVMFGGKIYHFHVIVRIIYLLVQTLRLAFLPPQMAFYHFLFFRYI